MPYIDSKNLEPEAREKLHRLLAKTEPELTPEDVAFLRARRDYVKDKHKDLFPSVFGKGGDKKQEEVNEVIKEKADDHEELNPNPENPYEEQTEEEEELLG